MVLKHIWSVTKFQTAHTFHGRVPQNCLIIKKVDMSASSSRLPKTPSANQWIKFVINGLI